MQVPIHMAETILSELIEAASRGEEVVIATGRRPVVKLVALLQAGFQVGILREGQPGSGPDLFEPMDEQGIALREGDA